MSVNDQFPTNIPLKYVPVDKNHLKILQAGEPKTLDLKSEFKDSTVVISGYPGAFTKVCSASHLPDYIKHIKQFKDKGVKNIIFLSVNDPFVNAAFGKALFKDAGVDDEDNYVIFATDPEGKLSKELSEDSVMDLSSAGMGLRLQRYAAIVENGIIKYLGNESEGNFTEISSAENLLKKL
ncbi:hypothetical protein KGF54_001905 [Candida jiufengensis]|uniref:uncharacterized protein n=1 Tax=Candida jiufengensis TaxID=497108 RepID=UPI0022244F7A|nr:uncharacterized protein KGF54_001905 [Candida jiufengensis]KAI5955344.1 hypothetical protein KGF54_001905 [Candida jiufengensis]